MFPRNFSYLEFQKKVSHPIDAQNERWWMSIEREHFDKIKIRSFRNNLRIRALMLTKSWWERSINSWRTRYFSFFLTSKDAWQRFCLIETWKFLGFTQDSNLSSSFHSCTKPQASLLLEVQWGDVFWQDRSLTWGFSLFTGNMSVTVCPSITHRPRSRDDLDSQQAPILFHPFSIPHPAPPPSMVWVRHSA